ncbi:hypothetical protein AAH354_004748 [Citrobacter sedlakii]|uniref:Uncharacterized protein n=1 Tax=Salmonella enterica I TaxID=59201 RepID=F2Q959_SALET|nr:hypothetical protein [Salmonella enterica]ELM6443431.1 hypothetical protein [Salmonella enterica]CAX68155.1 hypothetical protein CTnscr_043 [Salmonella enterica subsp. enterica] [Salmonella enterica subsp. enterica serovar Senftenberg]
MHFSAIPDQVYRTEHNTDHVTDVLNNPPSLYFSLRDNDNIISTGADLPFLAVIIIHKQAETFGVYMAVTSCYPLRGLILVPRDPGGKAFRRTSSTTFLNSHKAPGYNPISTKTSCSFVVYPASRGGVLDAPGITRSGFLLA